MTARLCCVLLFLAFVAEIDAGIILNVAGPNDWAISPAANPSPSGIPIYLVASWTQTVDYSNVAISIRGSGVSPAATGSAYLTSGMGPGTTAADQVAFTVFDAPAAPSSWISLFSGLTLPPNSYYLTIIADPGSEILWDATSDSSVTISRGVGVTLVSPLLYHGLILSPLGGSLAPYPPASSGIGFQNHLIIDVASVPEPSSVLLLAGGGFVLMVLSRRRGTAPARRR